MDEVDDLVDRRPRERLLDLPDEERGLVRAPGQAEEREGEEGQWDEGEKREVGDHRGQVRAAVGEELLHQVPSSDSHFAGSIP